MALSCWGLAAPSWCCSAQSWVADGVDSGGGVYTPPPWSEQPTSSTCSLDLVWCSSMMRTPMNMEWWEAVCVIPKIAAPPSYIAGLTPVHEPWNMVMSWNFQWKAMKGRSLLRHMWGNDLSFDPGLKDHCFFQSILFHTLGQEKAKDPKMIAWLRRSVAAELLKDDMKRVLHQAANDEHVTCKDYVKLVKGHLWGGFPEALAVAHMMDIGIRAYSVTGELIYQAGSCDGKVCDIGLWASHYVALKQRSDEPHGQSSILADRGGAFRQPRDEGEMDRDYMFIRQMLMRRVTFRNPFEFMQKIYHLPTFEHDNVGFLRNALARIARVLPENIELAIHEGEWLPDWAPLPLEGRFEAVIQFEQADSDIEDPTIMESCLPMRWTYHVDTSLGAHDETWSIPCLMVQHNGRWVGITFKVHANMDGFEMLYRRLALMLNCVPQQVHLRQLPLHVANSFDQDVLYLATAIPQPESLRVPAVHRGGVGGELQMRAVHVKVCNPGPSDHSHYFVRLPWMSTCDSLRSKLSSWTSCPTHRILMTRLDGTRVEDIHSIPQEGEVVLALLLPGPEISVWFAAWGIPDRAWLWCWDEPMARLGRWCSWTSLALCHADMRVELVQLAVTSPRSWIAPKATMSAAAALVPHHTYS